MKPGSIGLFDVSACAPVFQDVPGKGVLFLEDLAKVGASDRKQIYGGTTEQNHVPEKGSGIRHSLEELLQQINGQFSAASVNVGAGGTKLHRRSTT